MPKLYVAAYLPWRPHRLSTHLSRTVAAFCAVARAWRFPYDGGDDPAFLAATYTKGPVTWGVCRAHVRNAIQPGDCIAFLSAESDGQDDAITRYRFLAALCVELTAIAGDASDSEQIEQGLATGRPGKNTLVPRAPSQHLRASLGSVKRIQAASQPDKR